MLVKFLRMVPTCSTANKQMGVKNYTNPFLCLLDSAPLNSKPSDIVGVPFMFTSINDKNFFLSVYISLVYDGSFNLRIYYEVLIN